MSKSKYFHSLSSHQCICFAFILGFNWFDQLLIDIPFLSVFAFKHSQVLLLSSSLRLIEFHVPLLWGALCLLLQWIQTSISLYLFWVSLIHVLYLGLIASIVHLSSQMINVNTWALSNFCCSKSCNIYCSIVWPLNSW